MTRTEEKAREYENSLDYYHYTSDNPSVAYKAGYEQAEKDLALSLAQVVKLDNIIMNMVGEGYNDGYKTRPFYEEVLKRFNEQRNGRSNLQEMP